MSAPPLTSSRALYFWTINLLRKHGIRPRKKLSQNFIVNPRIIHDFLKHVLPNKTLLEIGAGIGSLSYYLSRKASKYSVFIEIDERLSRICRDLISPRGILINGNALDLDWSVEQVISNAPYHITSDIIVKTARSNSVGYAVFVFQKDVVDRLLARPGTKEYGRITVLTRLVFDIEKGPVYPPIFFYPRPEVSSQMIILKRKRRYDEVISRVEDVTRLLFSKRRKKALKTIMSELGLNIDVIRRLGIDDKARVYDLSPEVFLKLAEEII